MGELLAHRVVIVGGGFGGLFAARFLKRANVSVTLIDRRNTTLSQQLLSQVAPGILSEGEVAPAIRDVLRRHRNVRVELATVTGFDLKGRVVTAARPDGSPRTYPYDSLIVAAGAGQSYFGHDEFSRWAPGMKTINDALELRGRIFGACGGARPGAPPGPRRAWRTFVVVGGGATGVEIAGQIAELARHALKGNFRQIRPDDAKVILFDGGKELLANFGDRLSGKAASELERLGVEIRCGSIVAGMDAFGVTVKRQDGSVQRLPSRTKVWAAGGEASPLPVPLAGGSGPSSARPGRIEVLADCTLPGHPEVFAIGDMMSLDRLPGVAEVAMQSGIHAANTIKRRLSAQQAAPFKYRDLGSMATISRFRAVVSFKGLRLSGFTGWLMWLVVHVTFLTGFKNRFTSLLHWANTFLGGQRAERTPPFRQGGARVAVDQDGGDKFMQTLIPGQDRGAEPEAPR